MKIFITSALVILSFLSFGTNYQTIDVGGVIKWSTDGGLTDCGCQASSASKNDSILVFHPYTFAIGYFGLDGEISPALKVAAGITSPVVFEDNVVLDKVSLLVDNSNVIFNGSFDIKSAGQNLGGVFTQNGSTINFKGDFGGKENGGNQGVVALVSSSVIFDPNLVIKAITLVTGFNSNVTIGNNTEFINSLLLNADGSALSIGNGVRFEHTEFFLYSNNVTFGSNVKFTEKSVVGFGENMNVNIPSSTVFTETTLNFFSPDNLNGAIVNFASGVEIIDCEIHITNGAIANFDDPLIREGVNRNSVLTVDGLLDLDGVVSITSSDFTVQSSGIINLIDATSCDFDGSSINGKNNDAEDVLTCGGSYNPDKNDFNIWENGSWSQGLPPNHVGVLAEIRATYITDVGGDVLCANLYIEEEVATTISERGFIRVTQDFNNLGTMTIKNEGSLLLDENTYFHEENGVFKVERAGQLSSMKYNVWSSPVKEVSLLEMYSDANPCDMFVFDGNSQLWGYDFAPGTEVICTNNPDTVIFSENDVVSGADGLMNPGLGYFIPGNDINAVRVFEGQIHNGVYNQSVKTTSLGANANWPGDDWNLLGNPYPSALDLNLFWSRNAVQNNFLTDALYFWVETINPPYDAVGSYEAWNFTGGTYFYTNGKANGVDGVIPAGLGFWAVAKDPNNDGSKTYKVVYDNTMREVNQVMGTASKHYEFGSSEHQRMWVNLTNDSNHYDQVLIGTHPLATNSIDLLFDAHVNYSGEPLLLAIVQDSQYFTIAGYAPRIKVDTSEIELLVVASNSSNHYITFDSNMYFMNQKRIYLVDKLKQTEQELSVGQPQILDIDSAGRYDNRFYLKVVNWHISSVDEISNEMYGRVWSSGNEIYYDSFKNKITHISVYDLTGVELFYKKPNNRNDSFILPLKTEGVFIIRFTDEYNNLLTKRVYIGD